LRDGEQTAFGVLQGEIHLPVRVGEDAISDDPLGEARGLGLAIAALDADERHDSRPDRANDCAIDSDARLEHALYQSDHAIVGRAITRSWDGRSRDDVGYEAGAQALDLVLEEELALLQAPQLELVLGQVGGEPADHVIEIVVLDFESLQALADLRFFLFGKREVRHL